jgi:hypothetical protein
MPKKDIPMIVTRMTRRTVWLLLAVLVLAACGVDAGSAPPLTPDPDLPATAAALFPTPIPSAAPTATPVAESDAGEAIARVLRNMQNAVLTRNADAYLEQVALDSDPVFALEHRRWVEDWDTATGGVIQFAMEIRNLVVEGDTATAELNMTWSALVDVRVSRGADYPVRFLRGADGQWRYAGEAWVDPIETEHFIVRAMPGTEDTAAEMAIFLPDVYAHVTQSLGHELDTMQEIKIYDTAWDLIGTTRLSLMREIAGWNEPGESLKLVVDSALEERIIAHELTHSVTFDIAGGRGEYPWWLSEGISEYVAATGFETRSDRTRRLLMVDEERRTNGLAQWDDIDVFEETPEALWRYAYLQGYAFVAYVTDVYGQDARNAWIRAVAADGIEAGTQAVFEITFDDLDNAFLPWLEEQIA